MVTEIPSELDFDRSTPALYFPGWSSGITEDRPANHTFTGEIDAEQRDGHPAAADVARRLGNYTSTSEFYLPAAGVYAKELQLDDEQTAALKKLLHDQGLGEHMLQSQVISNIIAGMLVDDAIKAHYDDTTGRDIDEIDLLETPVVADLVHQAAYLGSSWQQGLNQILSIDEWPSGATPAATFAEALKRPNVIEFLLRLRESNPETDFTSQNLWFEKVTGIDLTSYKSEFTDGTQTNWVAEGF